MISHRSRRVPLPEYISPLPADIFLKGIQYRQNQYDEGRALVQTQLDNYRKIKDSLIKPQDKEYFDQEALKLVKAINSKAGLDFSIKANVHSVLNAGNQLISDPTIKQAAESTATYRKMMEEYNKLDSGKKSKANDYFFFKDIKSWMDDGKYGSKLNYNPYTVYTDEHIKLRSELVSKLKPNITEEFQPTPDGKFIVKYKYSGVSADKFKKAYLAGLSEQAKNQLRMESMYQVETGDKAKLSENYTNYLTNVVSELDSKINLVNTDKAQKIKKYGESAPELNLINSQLADLTMKKKFYSERLNRPANEITDNELATFLQDELITDASEGFAYQQVSKDLINNPYTLDNHRAKNDLLLHKEKMKFNVEMGLNPDGSARKAEDLLPFGVQKMSGSDIANSRSLLPGVPENAKKQVQSAANDFYGKLDEKDDGMILGIARYLQLDPATGKPNKTIADVLQRSIVFPTWNDSDKNAILNNISSKAALENQDPESFITQFNTKVPTKKPLIDINIPSGNAEYINQTKAAEYLKYLSKIAGAVYKIYDFQQGGEGREVTDDLIRGKKILNQNAQSSNYADLLADNEIDPNYSSVFDGEKGTGLTFVPRTDYLMVVYKDKPTGGTNYQKLMSVYDFLAQDATQLGNIQDIREMIQKQ